MALDNKPLLARMVKHGTAKGFNVPKHVLARLGWNYEDAFSLAVVGGSLVVTKITMPQVPDIRRGEHATSDK